MTDKASLMKVKATLKKRQPKFIRQDAHKHKRVKQVWRAPKGLHSKMKDSKKGYRAKLQGGYQTPKAVRGLDKHGLKPTLVAGAAALATLDPKTHSLILEGGLGGKKKLAILDEAAKHKFVVLNAKADTAATIKSRVQKRHDEKKAREESKTERQKSLEAKEAESKKKAKEAAGEDHDIKSEHKHDHKHDKAEETAHDHKEQAEKDKVLHQKE